MNHITGIYNGSEDRVPVVSAWGQVVAMVLLVLVGGLGARRFGKARSDLAGVDRA